MLPNVKMNFLLSVLLCYELCSFALCQEGYEDDGFHSLLHQHGNADTQNLNYCRISTRDLMATAESTANRVLKGVCNPRELNEKFTAMESQIVDQFNVLKTMVLNIEDKLRDQDEKVKTQHRKLHRAMSAAPRGGSLRNPKLGNRKPTPAAEISENEEVTYDYFDDKRSESETDEFQEQTQSPREPEIIQYNSSMHQQNGSKIFTYYWTIKDMTYRMKNWGWRRSLRSDSFYIFQYGYRMYMRMYPNQNGKNIYIHVGLTQGEYDAALDWPFKLKHKIQILDHEQPAEDLSSRVWDPKELCSGWNWRKPDTAGDNYECVGLGFPQETLKAGHYKHNDSITVKLTVFLD